MTPERFRQVRNLFEAALEKDPAERRHFLAEAVLDDDDLLAQAMRMLDAHGRTVTFLDGSLAAPADLRTDPRRLEGRRLGAYEVLREIGRGGMGTVYLARRADGVFQQQVAIKVVNPETSAREIVERFEQEREILASLEHPNIARLYDGGSTDEGWPYFVMEYVDGKPIDEWCDARKQNVSARLELFRTVCAAVSYAHHKRVVHRDLKPGNILVTEDGTVKLLDFGIAKLVRVEPDEKTVLATRTGVRMMTPEYASPEQIRAEETSPLTDLYSLGVILYELLTGRRPYRLKSRIFHEVVRVVCEQPVTRPSSVVLEPEERLGDHGKTLTIAPGLLSQAREGSPNDLKRRLSGDLDGILLKALEKAPRDRYRSVDQFSSDLDRHLNGQPVLAGGGGRFEAITLALSRHRLTVVAAVALLLALYVGGIRVDWRGFAVLSGAAALLGLWHLATDRTFGAAFSERVYGMSAPIVVVGGFALIIAITATNRYFGRWTELPLTRTILLWVMSLGAIYVIGLITAWFVRGRWAGALQFEERQPPNRAWMASIVLFVNMGNLLRDLGVGGPHGTRDLTTWTEVLLLLCAQVYILRISNRFEVRDRGLMVGGRLISWLNIESYEWEGVASPEDLVSLNIRQKRAVLRLNVRRLFAFIPPPRIRISDSRQALLEDVLNRHLSVWPGEIKHGAGPLPQ